MQVAWEARSGCFAGALVLCCVCPLCPGWKNARLCSVHALIDQAIWVDPSAGEEEKDGVVWQVKKTRPGEQHFFVPAVCESSHGGNWVHCGACGSADLSPFLVVSSCKYTETTSSQLETRRRCISWTQALDQFFGRIMAVKRCQKKRCCRTEVHCPRKK